MARFGQNTDHWTLDSMIGNLEGILSDEEGLQERKPTKKRAKQIEQLEQAIDLLYQSTGEYQ